MRGLKLLILKILGLFFPKWQIIPKEAGTTGSKNTFYAEIKKNDKFISHDVPLIPRSIITGLKLME